MDDDLDWFDPDHLQASIERSSRERRADPAGTVAQTLKDLWTDNTDEEAYDAWRSLVQFAPHKAEDFLFCAQQLIQEPPPDLPEILYERGDFRLFHRDGTAQPYDTQEVIAWLIKIAGEFQALYEETHSEPGVSDE